MKKKILIATLVVIAAAVILMKLDVDTFNEGKKIISNSVGVTDTEIRIGSSSALSGHAGQLGTNYLHGALSYINQVNKEGGINGRKIHLISYDDQYDPPTTIINTQKLINEDKVFALFNYVGTPTTVRIIPIINEVHIPLVGMFTGAHVLRQPVNPYIFNIRASYYQETSTAVSFFVDQLKLKKIAIFYQADPYGLDGLEGAKIALKNKGLEPVTTASYVRGTLDVENAADIITRSGADGVIMVGTYSPAAKFVLLVKQKNPAMVFHSVSFVGPEQFAQELKGKIDQVYVTQVVPPPYLFEASLYEFVKDYRENLTRYYPGETPNFGGMEGYLNAKLLTEVLKRCGNEITREKFISVLESMDNYSIGIGTSVTFSKDNHQGLNKIFLTKMSPEGFEVVEDRKNL